MRRKNQKNQKKTKKKRKNDQVRTRSKSRTALYRASIRFMRSTAIPSCVASRCVALRCIFLFLFFWRGARLLRSFCFFSLTRRLFVSSKTKKTKEQKHKKQKTKNKKKLKNKKNKKKQKTKKPKKPKKRKGGYWYPVRKNQSTCTEEMRFLIKK